MKLWIPFAATAAAFLLVSCGAPPVLEVRPFHVRTVATSDNSDPAVRGEIQRRFHGAVSVAEQAERLGYIYTVLWNDDSSTEAGQIVFEYQQGSTGSRVKTISHPIPAGKAKGRTEFQILGDDYIRGGHVLAWRCRLIRGGREVASKRSYLWQ